MVLPCTLSLGRIVSIQNLAKASVAIGTVGKLDVVLCSAEEWQGRAYTICRVLSVKKVQRAVWEEQASCLHLCPLACMNILEPILTGSAEDGSALQPQPPIEFHRKTAEVVVMEQDRRNDPPYTLQTTHTRV